MLSLPLHGLEDLTVSHSNRISGYMYRKFGSKLFIDIMSSLGFSSSNHETQLFEVSTIMQQQAQLIQSERTDAFCQLIFDNVDFNTTIL